MKPLLALIFCTFLILWLLTIERKRNPAASLALWLPTFWMLIYASRPVGRWLQSGGGDLEAGSPLDRLVLGLLIISALVVIHRRRIDWSLILEDNLWLLLLFLYMGISILWSDSSYVSFKRWFRSIGDILMAIVVLSEREPRQALESVFRRCAYVLLPLSLVLIKYFPHIGRDYGRWNGLPMWTGVTTHKNGLGQLCALSAFFFIWVLLRQRRSGNPSEGKGSQTLVDLFILGLTLFLLAGSGYSYSATSIAIFVVGITMLLMLYGIKDSASFMATHFKGIVIVAVIVYLLFSDLVVEMIAPFLGRDSTLTGRTSDIWRPLLDVAAQHPLFGAGFGGFWGVENPDLGVLQAHNGYLDIFIELGYLGLVLLAAFLLAFCGKVQRMLDYSRDWGFYGICFLLMTLSYNLTESSLLQALSYLWSMMVFLTIVFSEPCLHREEVVSAWDAGFKAAEDLSFEYKNL